MLLLQAVYQKTVLRMFKGLPNHQQDSGMSAQVSGIMYELPRTSDACRAAAAGLTAVDVALCSTNFIAACFSQCTTIQT